MPGEAVEVDDAAAAAAGGGDEVHLPWAQTRVREQEQVQTKIEIGIQARFA